MIDYIPLIGATIGFSAIFFAIYEAITHKKNKKHQHQKKMCV